ncbi:ribosome assembly factor SBDS [Methanomicrobium antiquum]|uniref:Ribosome assembly factor SBDS n=1 Tax=Methanomicrobium antiquum TaxID=487686 RepID=A0AAF0FZQ8_9EURY|nr:ribosome assembly factor SBDS [Methanomicrobium antiquum]MDD3976546.1 ribosome assembly factor SBDS [Methanomicrobium sp.]WFN37489.1 ribosome assembly factor SBDS [Methanomicrobium antiquum]
MISLEQAVVARLESHGERFEILVDPDAAARIRQGEDVNIEDVVAALFVFENASKTDKASEESLKKVFETTDFAEIAERIIKKGEIHLTSDQRKQMTEAKRAQVITFISRNAINPQTKLPHPPKRIEMAMEEARVSIDPFRHLDEQVKDVIKALRPILPIKFAEMRFAVKIPADYAPKAYGEISSSTTLEREEWQKDGSWICVCKIPAGIQEEFYNMINRLTKGDGEVRILSED